MNPESPVGRSIIGLMNVVWVARGRPVLRRCPSSVLADESAAAGAAATPAADLQGY